MARFANINISLPVGVGTPFLPSRLYPLCLLGLVLTFLSRVGVGQRGALMPFILSCLAVLV
jgi:hypothetical protein